MSDINYKVRARGKWDWKKFDTVRMEISVGQAYHEGDKLRAAMDWARESFGRRVLIVGDAPQRYNLMFTKGYSEEMAYAAALKAGDEWLERNKRFLHGVEIVRWEAWKQRRNYKEVHGQISDLYKTNPTFHSALREATDGIWLRRYAGAGHDRERFYALSEQYLLEETAVFAVAFDELGGISAYPGDFLKIWENFIDAKGQGMPVGLSKAHWVRLSFEKKIAQAVTYASNDHLNISVASAMAGSPC